MVNMSNETPRERGHYGVEGGLIGPPEKAHGQFEVENLYSDELIRLNQIRGTRNKVSAELKDSIRHDGLMNSIDCARVSRDLLEEYIEFTNMVWGGEVEVDHFQNMQKEDGSYRLVIAGHTRHEAISELEDPELEETPIRAVPLHVKIHDVRTVEDIVQLQKAENTHSTPSQERVAMAEVEAYLWGVEKGQWSTPSEYMEAHPGTSRRKMKEALAFHMMPREARSFVHRSVLPYLVGVELGKSMMTLKEYEAYSSGFDGLSDDRLQPGSEENELLDKLVNEQVIRRCTVLVNKRLNSTAGKAHVQAWRTGMEQKIAHFKPDEGQEDFLELELISPLENLRRARKEVKRQVGVLLAEMTSKPTENFIEALRLNAGVVGDGEIESLLLNMEDNLRRSLTKMGAATVSSVRGE